MTLNNTIRTVSSGLHTIKMSWNNKLSAPSFQNITFYLKQERAMGPVSERKKNLIVNQHGAVSLHFCRGLGRQFFLLVNK